MTHDNGRKERERESIVIFSLSDDEYAGEKMVMNCIQANFTLRLGTSWMCTNMCDE